jgi:hypothetical protein
LESEWVVLAESKKGLAFPMHKPADLLPQIVGVNHQTVGAARFRA